MTKVKLKVTKDDLAAADQSFEQAPPGVYVARLSSLEFGYSKTDGEPDPERPRLECIYTIERARDGDGKEYEPEKRYSNIFDYVTFGPKAGFKRGQFAKTFLGATEEQVQNDELDFDFDTDEMEGRLALITVATEEGGKNEKTGEKYPDRARIRHVGLYGDGVAGDDPFSGEGDAVGEDDFYTEEQLLEMEPADLKAACAEFDLDPKAIAKGKKGPDAIKAVVAAIIEAQAAPEDNGAAEDDDEPF